MNKISLYLVCMLVMVGMASAAITCNEVVSRSVSGSTLTYTVTGGTPPWGVLLDETVSGGCTFPSGGTTYKTGWFSDDGNTKTVALTLPASGSCTIHGNYLFGSCTETYMADTVFTIGGSCIASCSGRVCGGDGCGGSCGTCGTGTTCNSAGQCASSGVCTSGATADCSVGTCAGKKTCSSAGVWGSCVKTDSGCGSPNPSNDYCSFAGKLDFFTGGNDCTIGSIVGAAGIVLLLLLMKK
jgi:hypothetical protein